MNILQINKYHYNRGGSEKVFFNIMELLKERGHNVAPFSVVHPQNLPSEYDHFFVDAPELRDLSLIGKIKGLPRFFYNKRAAHNLQLLIDEFKPDIAHLHNIFNGLSLSILPVLARNNIPVVITLHDVRFICPTMEYNHYPERCRNCLKLGGIKCGIYHCYENSLVNSWMTAFEMFHKEYLFDYDGYIDRYHHVSQHYFDSYVKHHSYFGEKGVVIRHYVPQLDSITPNYTKGKYILYFGRVNEEKGVETLVEAMRHCPDIMLKIAGTGPLLEKLQAMQVPNVEYLGFVSGQPLEDTIDGASFVVAPSICEDNNPTSACEAMAFGKPLIGSEKIAELITPSSGFIFQSGDVNALAETIKEADALSIIDYSQMAHEARNYAERILFNREGYYQQLTKLYDDAMAHHQNKGILKA